MTMTESMSRFEIIDTFNPSVNEIDSSNAQFINFIEFVKDAYPIFNSHLVYRHTGTFVVKYLVVPNVEVKPPEGISAAEQSDVEDAYEAILQNPLDATVPVSMNNYRAIYHVDGPNSFSGPANVRQMAAVAATSTSVGTPFSFRVAYNHPDVTNKIILTNVHGAIIIGDNDSVVKVLESLGKWLTRRAIGFNTNLGDSSITNTTLIYNAIEAAFAMESVPEALRLPTLTGLPISLQRRRTSGWKLHFLGFCPRAFSSPQGSPASETLLFIEIKST